MDYLSLCLICKNENNYLAEWLDYHILLGVERFYIYDNESQVSLRETLRDYIQRGWVVVTDIHGKAMQLHAYDHCLRTYGPHTVWLGFIDTDEFLVPKKTLDLKTLLREYEPYAGLAVSSLFFGSNGRQEPPAEGQICGYTTRTHETFYENNLVKSIVRPDRILMPNTPHDFVYQPNTWCVNEAGLRVDYQRFPLQTDKIQLNHYFCRSLSEIEQKLRRGRGDDGDPWQRRRFEWVNENSIYPDTHIMHILEMVFQQESAVLGEPAGSSPESSLLQKMAHLASRRKTVGLAPVEDAVQDLNPLLIKDWDLRLKMMQMEKEANFSELLRLILLRLESFPHRPNLYVDLMTVYLKMNQPEAAWQALAEAWKLAPNSFFVLVAMTYYFLRVENFGMAEKTARLLLDIGPHDLQALGFLAEALIGQNRYQEGLKIGLPLIELSARVNELPEKMNLYLIRKMSAHLAATKNYPDLVRLWEAGVLCLPGDVQAVVELANALLLNGNGVEARQRLAQAQAMNPKHPEVQKLRQKIASPPVRKKQR